MVRSLVEARSAGKKTASAEKDPQKWETEVAIKLA
jgi:hypothetical protein